MRARDALEVWAVWWAGRRDRGWPSESIEARLMAHAGELVRATIPPGPRIPDIDRARLGPRIDRLLLDLESIGPRRARQAQALRLCTVSRGGKREVAHALGVERSTIKRRYRCGLAWLDEQLRLVSLEQRREVA